LPLVSAYGLALLAAGGALLSLAVPFFGLPIAAGSLASLVYGQRALWAAGSALGAGVALGALDPQSFAAVFMMVGGSLVVVGPVTAALLKVRSAALSTLVVALALAAIQAGSVVLLASMSGMTVVEYFGSIAGALAGAGIVPQADAEALQTQFLRVWPSLLAVIHGLSALMSVAAVGMVASRFGVRVNAFPSLHLFDLDARVALLPIAAAGLFAADRFSGGDVEMLGMLADNALIVARWTFFLQGIAVFAGVYQRVGLGRFSRSLGYMLLGVAEVLLPLVSLTGLADVWVNFRRLPREKVADGGPVEADTGRD
jgi:uncharacterized protein YybS (DUF2232 family)